MPFDDINFTPHNPRPERPAWPPDNMWAPGNKCTQEGAPCQGTAFGKDQPCNWCGRNEDGSFD